MGVGFGIVFGFCDIGICVLILVLCGCSSHWSLELEFLNIVLHRKKWFGCSFVGNCFTMGGESEDGAR